MSSSGLGLFKTTLHLFSRLLFINVLILECLLKLLVFVYLFMFFLSVLYSCGLLKFNSASDATKVVSSLKTIRHDLSVRLLQPHELIGGLI